MESRDFMQELGALALANRLKRLADGMMASGRKLYKELELDIEPSWYLIFLLLDKHPQLPVTEIAQRLHYSHPSVVTLISKMSAKGYVTQSKDPEDQRRQLVELSARAVEHLPQYKALWQAGVRAMEELVEGLEGEGFLESLDILDQRLRQRSFQQRTLRQVGPDGAIRRAEDRDEEALWEIFSWVLQQGEYYVFAPDTPRSQLASLWLAEAMHPYVFEDAQGQILGSYVLKPNQPGAGAHIANAAYMVHPDAQGLGLGHALCLHSIEQARKLGFLAMQFNVVVSTNLAAVALWKKHGFAIIGTTPEGFQHPTLGLVDTYIMHRRL